MDGLDREKLASSRLADRAGGHRQEDPSTIAKLGCIR